MQHLKNASYCLKRGRDKSPNLIFPGPNPSRTWGTAELLVVTHARVDFCRRLPVFFFYYQQCSFQLPLHMKLFLSTQKVVQVVDVWLVLGVVGIANLVTKWSYAIAKLLLSMLFAIIKLIISKPHIAVLVISKSFATIFLSFCLFYL